MRLYQFPFYLVLIAVCLAPLPFGSVQVGAWSLLALVIGLATAGWAVMVGLDKGPLLDVRRLIVPLILFGLVMAWILVQLSTLTPPAWHHPIWSMAGEALGKTVPGRISIDPQAGWFALLRLSSYAAIFWLAVQYGADALLAERALRIFTVSGAIVSGTGLLMWVAGLSSFLWFDEAVVLVQTRYNSRLAIPFVNPNHLASFAAMGFVCTVGLLIGETRGLWRPDTERREKLRRFVNVVVSKRWYLLVAGLLYAAAVLLSQSRGALLALALGLMVLAAALFRRSKPTISRVVVIVGMALVVAGLVFAPSISRFVDRASVIELENDQRLDIYATTIGAIEASPWLGYGYGGFSALYRMYDQNDFRRVVEFAHSTVLENAMELGLPAAGLLFAAIVLPVAVCWRGAGRRRRNQHLPALAAGMAVVGLAHSMVDFPLQIPAIAAGFSLVLGLGFAQSFSSNNS